MQAYQQIYESNKEILIHLIILSIVFFAEGRSRSSYNFYTSSAFLFTTNAESINPHVEEDICQIREIWEKSGKSLLHEKCQGKIGEKFLHIWQTPAEEC